MKVHQKVWSSAGVSTIIQPINKAGRAQKSSRTAISMGLRSSYILIETSLAAMDIAAVRDRKNQIIYVV